VKIQTELQNISNIKQFNMQLDYEYNIVWLIFLMSLLRFLWN